MLETIRRAVSFLRQKQILHKLGVVVSITVIGIACYVLYHMLHTIDTGEVVDAIKRTEPRQVVLAALFVTAGYFTLTFYDLFALRAIGRSTTTSHATVKLSWPYPANLPASRWKKSRSSSGATPVSPVNTA